MPISGVLRILVEFPRGSEYKSKVEGQDIIVYVTCDNLNEFFYEKGQTESEKILRDLKTLIRYVGMPNLHCFNQSLTLFSGSLKG